MKRPWTVIESEQLASTSRLSASQVAQCQAIDEEQYERFNTMGDKGGRKDKEKVRKQVAIKQKALVKSKNAKQTRSAEGVNFLKAGHPPSK